MNIKNKNKSNAIKFLFFINVFLAINIKKTLTSISNIINVKFLKVHWLFKGLYN